MRTGSPRERLNAAMQVGRILQVEGGERAETPTMEQLVDNLILVIRQEPDEWIARTLLDSLLWESGTEPNRLFRAALDAPSVNLQAVAVQRLTVQEDPDAVVALESLWKRDLPPWMRPRLIEALAEQGSATYLADFMRQTRSADLLTRRAALEALGTLARDEAIPDLIRAAREGAQEERRIALRALAGFPDSDEAFEQVRRAIDGGEGRVRVIAIEALRQFHRPERDSLLISLLDAPTEEEVQAAVAESLEESEHPDATEALVRLLHQPSVKPDSWVASTVMEVLFNRDDPQAIPGLMDLDFTADKNARRELGSLIEYLSRDRADGKRTIMTSTSCSFGSPVSEQDPLVWHVAPPAPLQTTRCWMGPDFPGDPDSEKRIHAGTLVLITDHFEARDESWVEIRGHGAQGCWVPLASLAKGPPAGDAAVQSSRHLRREFDIATFELHATRAARLEEAGLLKVFEPGADISGTSVEIDVTDVDEVALLEASFSRLGSPLDAAIESILDDIHPAATRQTEMSQDESEESDQDEVEETETGEDEVDDR